MFIAEKDNIIPIPSDATIEKYEYEFEQKFPEEYIKFIKEYNGCRPITNKWLKIQQCQMVIRL